MKKKNVFRAWGRIVSGYRPVLSVEITRECPLRCPGCYAYEAEHLGQVGPLRELSDYKGEALVDRVLALVRRYRPVHLSIVGGEPLVRFRELDLLLPQLSRMRIDVQLVTSAVRQIPAHWVGIEGLQIVVSIDGLQPEHDRRRAPATYDRILQNIRGHSITVHCTVTHQMVTHANGFAEFLTFWSDRPEVRNIWFSLFTPQVGDAVEEILSPVEREATLDQLSRLRGPFPKLYLPNEIVEGYRTPPDSPAACIFARTTLSITADLHNRITPCQFGGNPDCSQCGCMASAGLKAISEHRVLGVLPVKSIYKASDQLGKAVNSLRRGVVGQER